MKPTRLHVRTSYKQDMLKIVKVSIKRWNIGDGQSNVVLDRSMADPKCVRNLVPGSGSEAGKLYRLVDANTIELPEAAYSGHDRHMYSPKPVDGSPPRRTMKHHSTSPSPSRRRTSSSRSRRRSKSRSRSRTPRKRSRSPRRRSSRTPPRRSRSPASAVRNLSTRPGEFTPSKSSRVHKDRSRSRSRSRSSSPSPEGGRRRQQREPSPLDWTPEMHCYNPPIINPILPPYMAPYGMMPPPMRYFMPPRPFFVPKNPYGVFYNHRNVAKPPKHTAAKSGDAKTSTVAGTSSSS